MTAEEVTFGEASGRQKADFALTDLVGKTFSIKAFETQKRTIQDNETEIAYITLGDGKVAYTWSEIVVGQLREIEDTLKNGKLVKASLVQKKTSKGRYLALE